MRPINPGPAKPIIVRNLLAKPGTTSKPDPIPTPVVSLPDPDPISIPPKPITIRAVTRPSPGRPTGTVTIKSKPITGTIGARVSEQPIASSPLPPPVRTHSVTIHCGRFDPWLITIVAGESIRWTNSDTATHNVTGHSKTSPHSNKLIAPGQSASISFTNPGVWIYYSSTSVSFDKFGQPISTFLGSGPMMGIVSILPK